MVGITHNSLVFGFIIGFWLAGSRPAREISRDTPARKYLEPQCGESPGYLPGSLYGASATGEPAKSFFPSGSVTSRPFARKALSLA